MNTNIKRRKRSLGDWKAFEVSTKWFQFNGNVYNIKTKIHEDYRFLLISRKFHLILYILHFDHKLKPDQLNVKQENKTCSTCPFKFISKIWKSKSKHRTRSTTSKLNELVHFVSLHLRILTNTCVCQIQGQVSSCLAKKFGTKIYCCPPPCRIYVVDSFNQLEVEWLTLV